MHTMHFTPLYTVYSSVHCIQVRQLATLTLCNKRMHDIKKPRGYKPPVAKKKTPVFRTLSNGKVIPTFEAMVYALKIQMQNG